MWRRAVQDIARVWPGLGEPRVGVVKAHVAQRGQGQVLLGSHGVGRRRPWGRENKAPEEGRRERWANSSLLAEGASSLPHGNQYGHSSSSSFSPPPPPPFTLPPPPPPPPPLAFTSCCAAFLFTTSQRLLFHVPSFMMPQRRCCSSSSSSVLQLLFAVCSAGGQTGSLECCADCWRSLGVFVSSFFVPTGSFS